MYNMNKNEEWINPVGGLGDALMLSGVLKIVNEIYPERKFHLVRRTKYLSILKDHPAIISAGFPEINAKFLTNHYWQLEELGPGNQRPFQIISRLFGLKTPVDERLYIPEFDLKSDILWDYIPWKSKNIIFSPFSESPRKSMCIENWQKLADMLASPDIGIFIVGRIHDRSIRTTIRNTVSLLGLTTPRQLIYLLSKVNAVVTCDNFTLHAAHFTGTPTVSLWGATDPEVYGYPEQIIIKSNIKCEIKNECINSRHPENYRTPCPLKEKNCMDAINVDFIASALDKLLDMK